MSDASRKPPMDAAESETLRMREYSMHENRETPPMPIGEAAAGRPEKGNARTSGMNVGGESDGPIVPMKSPNQGNGVPAEAMEGRGPTKGNVHQTTAPRTQSRTRASSGLAGVRTRAHVDKRVRFTALLHHVTVDLLRDSFAVLKRQAAAGIDGLTWPQYEVDLETRLRDLHGRVHRGAYRAQPSKRAYIPKADGKRRPLGIAAL